MARILKQFDPGDQPRKHLGSLVASYASARIFDDPCFTAREKLAGCGVATQLARNESSSSSAPAAKVNGQYIYQMHVGTITEGGTWATPSQRVAGLPHIGITVIEMMPVADLPGKFGCGYDGVDLFAPSHLYATPQ